MSAPDCKACREYEGLSRRNFLGLSAGMATALLAPAWLPRVVFAEEEASERDVLVSLFLRGGADALTLCVPFGERRYSELRPSLAVPPPDSSDPNRALDLDGRFGLPPAMRALLEPFAGGDLLVVHACGLDSSSRSHFEAMHDMEVGAGNPPASLFTGWLGRHLEVTAPTLVDGALRAVAIGAGLPRALVGGPKAVPVQDMAEYGFEGRRPTRAAREAALAEMYAATAEPLATSAANTFRTIDLLGRIGFRGYRPAGGASYPDDELGYALKSTAALIKAQVGVEAVAIDLGGWDTHELQGPFDGHMAYLMTSLAEGLAAFHGDLEGGPDNVSLVAMSEFGRNASENGSSGTDHGHGGLMLAMGAGISGGRVLAEWPGLEPEELYQGQDLAVTIDYRDVLGEILTRRLGNPDIRRVFSDAAYRPRELGVTL